MARREHQKQTHLPWNWTDQRVQEIMKKHNQMEESEKDSTHSPWSNIYYLKPSQAASRQDYTGMTNLTTTTIPRKTTSERGRMRRGRGEHQRVREAREEESYQNNREVKNGNFSFNHRAKESREDIENAKKCLERKEKKYLRTEALEEGSTQRQSEVYKDSFSKTYKMKTEADQQQLKSANRTHTRVEYAPRISNIEKINNKIKKILESASSSLRPDSREPTSSEFKFKDSISSQKDAAVLNEGKLREPEIVLSSPFE